MAKLDILNEVKTILSQETDFLKPLLKSLMNEILEGEMSETVGAENYQRSEERRGYRAGHYSRKYITRVGSIELQVPRDREGKFSTELFERYQRSEKALLTSLSEMYIQGVSTRKVKAITEELCGYEFSASTVSNINKTLDEQLNMFAQRPLLANYPYIMLDARYEKIREGGMVTSQAVLIAIGITEEGKKEVLSVELTNRESKTSWWEFLCGLKARGLTGVRFIVSDSHEGLKRSIAEVFPEAIWQRCFVHFLRNVLDYLPRKNDEGCLKELRAVYENKTLQEALRSKEAWLEKWRKKYLKLCDWVEGQIDETFSHYNLPEEHRKLLRSTNFIERINEEIKRRTRIVRIFPNAESCLRLIRAVTVEIHETWLSERKRLNMKLLEQI
jgi:putative transposase